MGRTPSVAGKRPVIAATRLSRDEAAELDRLRGSLDRAAYLRWLILKASKEG